MVLDRWQRLTDLPIVNETEARTIDSDLHADSGILATTVGPDGTVLSSLGQEIVCTNPPRVDDNHEKYPVL